MSAPFGDTPIIGSLNPIEGKVASVPTHAEINEKLHLGETSATAAEAKVEGDTHAGDNIAPVSDIAAPPPYAGAEAAEGTGRDGDETVIRTGADASNHLLALRDDGDPALTFRGMFLATCLSAFQAVVYQIYQFKPTVVTIQGTFIVLIAYFAGHAWANFLPRGDRFETRWRQKGGTGTVPVWIRVVSFFNYGPWRLKEHAICAITATSASNAAPATQVFAAQDLFYGLPLKPATVILTIISIGLFGYGVAGILRPITVWHVDAVYWGTLPTVKTLQGLHWQNLKNSKPLRFFWYAFGSMFIYEFFPAYIFPWLNSVSIPCLAAMNQVGEKGQTLTNIFGGSSTNEGLGWFSLSFDWQYVTSFQTSLPLKLQAHQTAGLCVCFFIMIGIYWGNAWNAKSQPFMSTRLRSQEGGPYPITEVFKNGILDQAALEEHGIPTLTGTMAYAMFMANAAIGALIAHCVLFWGGDVKRAYKSARKGEYNDRHHEHMAANYTEVPWWWYGCVLLGSFILGLIVVLTQDITLPAWAYVVSLILGMIIAPFSCLLYSRFGNGIATNNLSKMLAGLLVPERPVGNMYFAAWSHNVINNTVNMCNDLKMGEYLKIPPRVMFLTQCYGTILGGFINYAVMVSIVQSNRDLLVNSDSGNSAWSGATIQSYNTNATTWALAKYLYTAGGQFFMVPVGIAIGAGLVCLHRVIYQFVPRVRGFALNEINLPQFIQYAGYIPYNQSQTCVLLTWTIAGFFTQFYLRNYRPRIFRDYSYLVTGAWDGATLTAMFILSFAVFGAGGTVVPFPKWWGNNQPDGYVDHCPYPPE